MHEPVDEPGRRNKVLLRRQAGPVRLTVFNGGHEGDMPTAVRWLAEQVKNSAGGASSEVNSPPAQINPPAVLQSTAAIPVREIYFLRDDRIVEIIRGVRLQPDKTGKRPDGLAGPNKNTKNEPGVIITKPIRCTDNQLRITADADGGAIRVGFMKEQQVTVEDYVTGKHKKVNTITQGDSGEDRDLSLESCMSISDDVADHVVQWKTGSSLADHQGEVIRLRFELVGATLYSFRFVEATDP
jgi:hypothetical protein